MPYSSCFPVGEYHERQRDSLEMHLHQNYMKVKLAIAVVSDEFNWFNCEITYVLDVQKRQRVMHV